MARDTSSSVSGAPRREVSSTRHLSVCMGEWSLKWKNDVSYPPSGSGTCRDVAVVSPMTTTRYP